MIGNLSENYYDRNTSGIPSSLSLVFTQVELTTSHT